MCSLKFNERNFIGDMSQDPIYYNAVILNELKEESDRKGDTERSQKLIRLSPVAWTHINFQGIYIFMGNDTSLDLNDITKALFNVNF